MSVDSLANRISQAAGTDVDGVWQRHVAPRYAVDALAGRSALGRWGTPNSYPVLYLGQPTESVIVEAYRHLVDPVENTALIAETTPRVLITCTVRVTEILDLRTPGNRLLLDVPLEVLQSTTRDRQAYLRCQELSAVTHQLGFHGIIAPAATGLGTTLALFPDLLGDNEQLIRTGDNFWAQLPPDPRRAASKHLRAVPDSND